MKVTVCFGKTGIVVPCKDGEISVRELIQQAAQRYIKAKEKVPGYWVKIHHLEYKDGGILDPDDVVADVVEDKDKLIAVFDEQDASNRTDDVSFIADHLNPDPFETELSSKHQPLRGEIEVTPSALKLGTPLLVRRSSDPTMGPVADFHPGSSHDAGQNLKLAVQRRAVLTEDQRDLTWQEEQIKLKRSKYMNSELTRKVEISGDDGPLGIHVVPFYSSFSGRALGLYIRGIEEDSRTKQDGIFHENECIVKINKIKLLDKSFTQAQDIFRQAMKYPSVLVEVVPSYHRELYEKANISTLSVLNNYDDEDDEIPNIKPPPPPGHGKLNVKMLEHSNGSGTAQPKQIALVPDLTSTVGAYSPPSLSPLGFGSKRYAKRIRIDLKKGPDGLGFTVVTRDSTVHGPGPIFVKNILPKGAAIKDGRLQSGDRIIEVKGQAIAGKTQEELVAMLRSTKLGETVALVVARQEDAFLPRELKDESENHAVSPEKVEQMTFEIPLNETGSAGLGVSLKGNKSRDTSTDLGIFIKSIIHGGAAFKDGRLRVNDQLVAVNGESLLGKSNREAMETLRRSMSMEGNIRGMIQLVILRKLNKQTEEHSEPEFVLRTNLENHMIEHNGLQNKMKGSAGFDAGSLKKDFPLPLAHNPEENIYIHSNFSSRMESSQQPDTYNMKTSKSMDLVADESNIASINGHKEVSPGKDLGPRLGLKKSSSLESLQTAVAEVKKNELPFYRPRPNMVRGRGCNESFRAAIDKSYDGPESDDDGLSDVSSHSDLENPSGEPVPLGNQELDDADKAKKDKKKKDKKKEKEKGKLKVKDKKKKEESEEQEKKAKKKGFGAMLRFGKKNKDDKGGKLDQKGSMRPATLKEEEQEVEKMREERESINAKHQEIREKQAKVLWNFGGSHDIEDDDMDPNYARVNHFKEPPPPQHNSHRPYSPAMPGTYSSPRETLFSASERDQVQDLYAKVNKRQQAPDAADSGHPTSGNVDRIQQLRMEYQQAKREGFSLYENEDVAGRFEQGWVPARGPSGSRNLSFEGIERQYASLPRPGPVEPIEYTNSPRAMYKAREPPYYYDVASPSAKGTYPRSQSHEEENYRFPPYHPPSAKGPLRQDVPPSPPQANRLPGYGTGERLGQDRYQYRTQDPRQKNAMTAAV
ncbi:partitioning defective 3 homolog B isoform X2 [Bufo gargarizans]|uniref:partitioning defective 3 homolog B isoform X2 n=1 Tax=Bufo gargarizans TaxID=30331 RepID=UPI001CF44D1C|nr:partitioning defective 3 homolog B isoform X2 [Bufo gargarizans]